MGSIRPLLNQFALNKKDIIPSDKTNKSNKRDYKDDIILIGPIGAGKSTIAKLISDKLGLPQCSIDSIRWDFYKEAGYDEKKAERIRHQHGLEGVYKYWKEYEAYAVERIMDLYKGYVFDFGSGHSVYEDEKLFNKVKKVLEPYKNVILLLPSEDVNESMEILAQRKFSIGSKMLNKHFLTHPSNKQLAKVIVYTKGKTPEETAYEIIKLKGLQREKKSRPTRQIKLNFGL